MKENSIEEGIKILENFINWLKTDFEYNSGEEIKAIEHILSDYKRVLKENGILKEEKEQAWEEWNNLEQGSYETEQKLKQQIKELQKENEELKLDLHEMTISNEHKKKEWIHKAILNSYIPKQKIKDKIEESENV